MYLYEKTINFYDCDPAGILFYARIYELTHAAYEGLIDSFNLGEDYWANDDYVVPDNCTARQDITSQLLTDRQFRLRWELQK